MSSQHKVMTCILAEDYQKMSKCGEFWCLMRLFSFLLKIFHTSRYLSLNNINFTQSHRISLFPHRVPLITVVQASSLFIPPQPLLIAVCHAKDANAHRAYKSQGSARMRQIGSRTAANYSNLRGFVKCFLAHFIVRKPRRIFEWKRNWRGIT